MFANTILIEAQAFSKSVCGSECGRGLVVGVGVVVGVGM